VSLNRFLDDDRPPIMMRSSDKVIEAVDKMAEANEGSVLILRDDGSLEGIFTERDLLIRVVNGRRDVEKTNLGEVMTKDVIRLSSSSTLDQAIRIMAENHIRHLPIEGRSQKITGIISLRHLLHDKIDQVIQDLKLLEDFDDQVPGG
jgi:CBS domain-containing protein